jgi:hypothetical protein
MAKLIGTVMLLWLVSMPVGASAHDACELTRARDRGRTGDAHLGKLLGLWGKGLSAAAAEMG